MMRTGSIAAAGLLLLAACGGRPPPGAEQRAGATTRTGGDTGGGADRGSGGGTPAGALTVMTRNLYLGADIRRIAATTSPAEIPAAAGAMWTVIQASDFPARAESIADEIGTANPELVALEEVSLYRVGPPASCVGQVLPATEVAIDFLALLQGALERRGLDYVVARSVDNFDAQLCTAESAESFIDVRLTDRDAILVRGDVAFSNARSGNFTAQALFPAGGGTLAIPRGWASIDVASSIGNLRFAASHLEVETFPAVQQAQAAELVAAVADGLGTMPVILAGDFNAGPELATVTTSYADLLAAGYRDPWPALHPADAGLTCCFDELLASGTLTQRIDLTLYQGAIAPTSSVRVGLSANTEPGLYPSDHAGVVTVFSSSGAGGCPDDDDDDCDCQHGGEDCGEHHGDRDCGGHHGDEDCGEHHGDRDCGEHHGDKGRGGHRGDEDCGEHHGDE